MGKDYEQPATIPQIVDPDLISYLNRKPISHDEARERIAFLLARGRVRTEVLCALCGRDVEWVEREMNAMVAEGLAYRDGRVWGLL